MTGEPKVRGTGVPNSSSRPAALRCPVEASEHPSMKAINFTLLISFTKIY
jgi:hypothetical protein